MGKVQLTPATLALTPGYPLASGLTAGRAVVLDSVPLPVMVELPSMVLLDGTVPLRTGGTGCPVSVFVAAAVLVEDRRVWIPSVAASVVDAWTLSDAESDCAAAAAMRVESMSVRSMGVWAMEDDAEAVLLLIYFQGFGWRDLG